MFCGTEELVQHLKRLQHQHWHSDRDQRKLDQAVATPSSVPVGVVTRAESFLLSQAQSKSPLRISPHRTNQQGAKGKT
jgi:hypothetical protein